MTICEQTGLACCCQPDEGVPCAAENGGLKQMMLEWRAEAIKLRALIEADRKLTQVAPSGLTGEDSGHSVESSSPHAAAQQTAGRFRKRPVVIDAWCIDFDSAKPDWVAHAFDRDLSQTGALDWDPAGEGLWINTLEGAMVGAIGDMLIRGVKGELYACKPDIFYMTYEPVETLWGEVSQAAAPVTSAQTESTESTSPDRASPPDPTEAAKLAQGEAP
jgi:hypothetical protein